ncbi:MAG: acyltransferase [Planctomycetes bacterium]|nr:acyltransferase [Planctomycetota bacterium]
MKNSLKIIVETIALLLVFPAAVCCRVSTRLLGAERGFSGWSQAASLFPGLTGAYLRRAFYRMVLPRCGAGAWISFGTIFSHATAKVGNNVYVGSYCCLGDVTLEDDVLIASHVSITNGCEQHGIERLDVPVREQPGRWPHVTVGRDSWIGERSVIMADVGRQCVVGAGSVVTKPLPDRAIAHGVPAKIVRYRGEVEPKRQVAERLASEVSLVSES